MGCWNLTELVHQSETAAEHRGQKPKDCCCPVGEPNRRQWIGAAAPLEHTGCIQWAETEPVTVAVAVAVVAVVAVVVVVVAERMDPCLRVSEIRTLSAAAGTLESPFAEPAGSQCRLIASGIYSGRLGLQRSRRRFPVDSLG